MYARITPLIRGYVRYAYLRRMADYRRAIHRRPFLRYVGWLGHRNLGDEILFDAFRQSLFEDCLLLPHDDVSPLSVLANRSPAAQVVLGGGTLINDAAYLKPLQAAHRSAKPFFVFGSGVCDPDYWGKFPGARNFDADGWLEVLKAARYVGVRGPRSRDWLHAHGVAQAEVLGDPALSLARPPPGAPPGAVPVLGVNLGTHDPVLGTSGADFLAVLGLVKVVIARGWKVRYLAMHPIDQRLGIELAAAVRHPNFELRSFTGDIETMVRQTATCRAVVGERLHVTVIACALAVPNISLSYQPKCLDFLESIGRADLAVKTDDISVSALVERFDWLQDRLQPIADAIRERCDVFRSLQRRRARQLVATIERA